MNSKKLQTKTSYQKWTYEEHEYMVKMWFEKYYTSIRENKKYNVVANDLKHEWELFNKTFKKNRSYNSIYALVSNLKNLTFEEINKENRNEKSKKGFKNSAKQLRSIWNNKINTKSNFSAFVINNNDNEEIKKIENNPNLKETEKIQLIKARKGQGEFREKIIKEFNCCIFTNIDDKKILIASHIKPWRVSEDNDEASLVGGVFF